MSHVGKIIKGEYLTAKEGNPDTATYRFPSLRVFFGTEDGSSRQSVIGLLDTGADQCVVDEALVSHLPTDGFATVTQANGTQSDLQYYRARISLPDIGFNLKGKFTAVPMRSIGKRYDILLGLDFIRFFDFNVVPRENIVTLKWLGYD